MDENNLMTRRTWFASVLAGIGIVISYGFFAFEGLSFLLPHSLRKSTRKLFVGPMGQFSMGSVRSFYDHKGNEVLIKRDTQGFKAFSSTCPHLGCKVRWEDKEKQFFCPCHRGAFDENGIAIAGPPKDGNQNMYPVPLIVDEESGTVYVEIKV